MQYLYRAYLGQLKKPTSAPGSFYMQHRDAARQYSASPFKRSADRASEIPPIVHNVLQSSGQSLDAATRTILEPRFGHDFSRVRVHHDDQAAESAQAVQAEAYTVGQDIVFGTGQYAPATAAGQRLLAHELAHVCFDPPGPLYLSPLEPGGLVAAAARSFPANIKFGSIMEGNGQGVGILLNRKYWVVEYILKRGGQEKIFDNAKQASVWPQVTDFLDNNPDWSGKQTTVTLRIRVGKSGAAAAIEDVWNPKSAHHYRVECYGAAALVELRGIYVSYLSAKRTVGDFRKDYDNFKIEFEAGSRFTTLTQTGLEMTPAKRLAMDPTDYQSHLKKGDWVYIENPYLVDPWRGENAVYLGENQFFGHPIGVFSLQKYAEWIYKKVLPTHAKPGADLPASAAEVLKKSFIVPFARPRAVPSAPKKPGSESRKP